MASVPCLGRFAFFLPCPPLMGVSLPTFSGDLLPLSQPILLLFFLYRTSFAAGVRPAPSRPEDCALNQHFSSHLGTFVQRKMIL